MELGMRKALGVLLAAAVLAAGTFVSARADAAGSDNVDLREGHHSQIRGDGFVNEAGDVNGDGLADALVIRENKTWVVFGRSARSNIDVTSPALDGFVIRARDSLVVNSQGVGDVNGDGFDDVGVGAADARVGEMPGAGITYIVFGGTQGSFVDLTAFDRDEHGAAGFKILGGSSSAQSGQETAGLGDVNQDGLADLAIGAPFAAATYVVFGTPASDPVDLSDWDMNAQADRGYKVTTSAPGTNEDYSVAGAGDVNGDGRPDLLVGVVPGPNHPGGAAVVFGKADPLPVDTTMSGPWGFRVLGHRQGDYTGFANTLDGAGDTNGDGLGDLIIGASRIYENDGAGRAAIVFGRKSFTDIDLGALGESGYWIKGRWNDATGASVTSVGDSNGDGLEDVAVGAYRSDYNSRRDSGSVFVVWGKTDTERVELRRLGNSGVRIDGPWRGSNIGLPVAHLGDFDGDGQGDLAMGAYWKNIARVVFGRSF